MTGIIRQLLDFSRRRAATLATGDLVAITRRTLEFLSALATKRNVTLALDGDPGRSSPTSTPARSSRPSPTSS